MTQDTGVKLILELEKNVWLAEGRGDPARTLVRKNAKVMSSPQEAAKELDAARKYRLFSNAVIVELG